VILKEQDERTTRVIMEEQDERTTRVILKERDDRCGFAAGCEAGLCPAVSAPQELGLRPWFGLRPFTVFNVVSSLTAVSETSREGATSWLIVFSSHKTLPSYT
jgi:hypothetical protein